MNLVFERDGSPGDRDPEAEALASCNEAVKTKVAADSADKREIRTNSQIF